MPFPLSDLRRSFGRSRTAGGPADVRPYLLAGGELEAQRDRLRAVVAWHEAQVGRRRADVDADDLAQVAGDYRLARCLGACLQGWFRFAAEAPGEDAPGTPSELRLRVFERVARDRGGFVDPEARVGVLAGVAAEVGLAGVGELERLLWLDAEGNHRLARGEPDGQADPPSPAVLAAAYNRRALATLLVRALSADLVLADPDGAAIRRLYALVKLNGLLCDLELVDPEVGPQGGVHVHLYGPLEVFGPRTRHGDRFAGVLLGLLFRFPDLEGSARVLLNEREYRLVLGPDVAESLGAQDPLGETLTLTPQPPLPEGEGEILASEANATAVVARPEALGAFDSEVEARLFTTLRGMARRGDAAGWTAEREAEPLIQGTTVLVPDFVLSRTASRGRPAPRVFVEVIGFWTPAYRERKRDKLRQLGEQVPLVLVVQEGLAEHFQGLPFPVLTYKHRVPAGDLIRLLTRHFVRPGEGVPEVREDLEALLAALDPALGFVGVAELCRSLELPSAGALGEGAARARWPVAGWRWVAGAGVAHEAWLAALDGVCGAVVAGAGDGVALDVVRETVRGGARSGGVTLPNPQAATEHLEALLGVLGYGVSWQSLFDATVRRGGAAGATSASA